MSYEQTTHYKNTMGSMPNDGDPNELDYLCRNPYAPQPINMEYERLKMVQNRVYADLLLKICVIIALVVLACYTISVIGAQ